MKNERRRGNKFNHFDERIKNMERKILDMDENMSTEVKITEKKHADENQGKQ